MDMNIGDMIKVCANPKEIEQVKAFYFFLGVLTMLLTNLIGGFKGRRFK